MTNIRTREDISIALQQVRVQVTTTVTQLSNSQFFQGTDTSWSAADYLKHLILSVKPFARALELSTERLEQRFGASQTGSMTYEELVERYRARLQAGIRAEDFPAVTPTSYKFPDEVGEDIQRYLIETWDKANENLIDRVANWSEENLDIYQLPHPALSHITLREMCFFTIHHNQLHHKDIQQAALK